MGSLGSTRPTDKPLPTDFNSDQIVSPKVTAELLGISEATLRRLWANGQGPRKYRLSQYRLGSKLRDIQQYLDQVGGAA